MQLDSAILVGVLFGCATYLILQRSFVKILFGFIILTNAANLLVLTMSGEPEGRAAPVLEGEWVARVDPLPQALILTAIVIGLGLTAYLVVLLYRLFLDHGTTNAGELYADKPEEPEAGTEKR
jgi:multicomponent Na+:H+ antiporter subunit C